MRIQAAGVSAAERLLDLEFTPAEIDSMLPDLNENRQSYQRLRKLHLPNDLAPALLYNPLPANAQLPEGESYFYYDPPQVRRPDNLKNLAFYTVAELAELIRTRQVTSEELTQLYLARLKKYDPVLHCVVTLTEELALRQARQADAEIAIGQYRGPLHGIPYGAKDLLAVKGYSTTWGAEPYKDQVIDQDATVIQRLEEAGAVLVAKLTLGALAWGDVWFGGMTRNPWNTEQGSSGSSAGPGSATAAGLVAFAIGSETWGSIVSPATRNGVSGLRPTFGRVSRTGAMALSWSMDKLGPMCRSAEDCALVLNAIYGPDNLDQTVLDLPLQYDANLDIRQLKIGFIPKYFENSDCKQNDQAVMDMLSQLGAELVPIDLPDYPVADLAFILSAEAATAFDELTRSNRDELLVRQIRNAWPNVFRASRFIPAVEYLQANRVRTLLKAEMETLFKTIDLYVVPSFSGDNLLLTNLTGHPCVVVPDGFDEKDSPTSISFIGELFDEGTILAVAKVYQDQTSWHRQYPPGF
jgi:Asp-tRNA(Asn)/Glu-tRNA(Gln) amidotransferase A subunit family amidase